MEYREPSDIEIYNWEEGIIVSNNSLIAKQRVQGQNRDRIAAIGRDAQVMQQDDIYVYTPFRNGVIADWNDSLNILKHYINRAWKRHFFKKPKIAVCMVPGATGVEKTAMEEAMYAAGARKVLLTELTREEFTREDASKEYDLIISIGQNFRV